MPDEKYTQEVPAHTFNRAANDTIQRATSICNQRGGEYSDSWSLDNLTTPWLDNLLDAHPSVCRQLQPHFKRLIVMASMLDIKLSRLAGGWKDDTVLDSINYMAAYGTLRKEFEEAVAGAAQSSQCLKASEPTQRRPMFAPLASDTKTLGNTRP